MFRVICFGLGATLLCSPIAAQSIKTLSDVLTYTEVKDELFGVHLEGKAGLNDLPWSECIEPDGTTVYTYQGRELTGHVTVKSSGTMCFHYGGDDGNFTNCFRAVRNGKTGYTFYGGSGSGGIFSTTRVRRNVEVCEQTSPKIG